MNTGPIGTRTGTCHCGKVAFEVDLPNGFESLIRCNCSMCARRGPVVTAVPLSALRITQGADALRLYQFNTRVAEHYFCGTCGIYTHHKKRSNPNEYAVNVACIEDVNPFELGEISNIDGLNHVCDRTV